VAERGRPECSRNALLALHYGEGEPALQARTRAHAEGCADCADYLATLQHVEGTLRGWVDEAPPDDVWEGIRARIAGCASPARPARSLPRSAELLALLPAMAGCLALAWLIAGGLAWLPFWPWLAQWPAVQFLGSFGVAAVLLLVLGGLGSLALAPALLLENRKGIA
jgi:hypothetical protein